MVEIILVSINVALLALRWLRLVLLLPQRLLFRLLIRYNLLRFAFLMDEAFSVVSVHAIDML